MQGTVSQVLSGKRGVPLNNLNAWVEAMPVTAEEKASLYALALRQWAPDYVQDMLNDMDTLRETLRGVLVWLGTVVGVNFFDYDSPDVQRRVEQFLTEVSKGRFPPATIKQLRKGFIEMIIKSGPVAAGRRIPGAQEFHRALACIHDRLRDGALRVRQLSHDAVVRSMPQLVHDPRFLVELGGFVYVTAITDLIPYNRVRIADITVELVNRHRPLLSVPGCGSSV
jgi:hypothetical protein